MIISKVAVGSINYLDALHLRGGVHMEKLCETIETSDVFETSDVWLSDI